MIELNVSTLSGGALVERIQDEISKAIAKHYRSQHSGQKGPHGHDENDHQAQRAAQHGRGVRGDFFHSLRAHPH